MNKSTISLNGIWCMHWCDIGAGTPESLLLLPALPYTVPGDVHTPLIDAGIIAEPLHDMNNLDCRWVEEKEFWCAHTFTLTEEELAPVMLLTFGGLDCTADVYLNGQKVGSHNNAFVEISWDVANFLHAGENHLLVRIDQGLREAQTHDLARMGMMWNNEQPWRAWMRKPQFVYGWDWTIWLTSCGIWKDVTLTSIFHAAVTDVYVRTEEPTLAEGQPCTVQVTTEVLRHDAENATLRCLIRDMEGSEVAACCQPLSDGVQEMQLVIPQAHLWWCNGMGEAYLYTVTVSVEDTAGAVLDNFTQKLELRTITLASPVWVKTPWATSRTFPCGISITFASLRPICP